MRFLIDADLPRDTGGLLASFGHIGVDVRDIGLGSAKDPNVASYALSNGLCIATGDWGFSDIRAYPPTQYLGIVVLGLPAEASRQLILKTFAFLLNRPELVALLPGRLAIVAKNRIRLRPPP